MSTLTSDGKEFVYGVFGADGCECENLEAVFGSEQTAKDYIAELLAGPMWKPKRSEWIEAADNRFYGRADLLSVRQLEVRR